MRIILAFIAWFIFCFVAAYWMASEQHKPEIEAKKIKSLPQLMPDIKHCLQPIDVDCIVDDPR